MNLKPTARRVILLCLLAAVLISGFLSMGVRISAQPPVVREYTVESKKISTGLTLVMLSDLHGCEHGNGNAELIKSVTDIDPDLILLCGDMINHEHPTGEDILVTAALIRELSALAPIYYSLGNHELARLEYYLPTSLREFKDAGAVILEGEFVDIELKGNSLRIGGIYTPNSEETKKPDISGVTDFFDGFCDTDRFTVLMEHRPAAFTDQINPAGYEPELVLSGHLHGGHVILPLLGPVYGANYGLFPKYALGKFTFGTSTLIVSAGLSTQRHIIPRINNPAEITEIRLEPAK
ncbi:MAG: metallophosphoesterase [Eubacteriales bacterium]